MLTTNDMTVALKVETTSNSRGLAAKVVRSCIEKGQLVYRFNRNLDGLDTYVFVSFVESLTGNPVAVLNKSENTHTSNLFIDNTFVRDLLLSRETGYDSECYFLCKDLATRRLTRHIKNKMTKMLDELESQGE